MSKSHKSTLKGKKSYLAWNIFNWLIGLISVFLIFLIGSMVWDNYLDSSRINDKAIKRVKEYNLIPTPSPVVIDRNAELLKQNEELKKELDSINKAVQGL
jgi:hypothetical protein